MGIWNRLNRNRSVKYGGSVEMIVATPTMFVQHMLPRLLWVSDWTDIDLTRGYD